MHVKVEIELTEIPGKDDREQAYEAAIRLTNDRYGVSIVHPSPEAKMLVAEFTIPTARQLDVVDGISRAFWTLEKYNTTSISFPDKRSRAKTRKYPAVTAKQGQYLAFIHYYTKIHGMPPAQADIQRYFRVAPPTVHQMLLKLEKLGLIFRVPHQSRSLHVLLPRDQLPDLD